MFNIILLSISIFVSCSPKPDTTVKELSHKVFHSKIKIKEIRITGPSSKFSNQVVGLKHKLKDKDIVEFHTE